MRQEFPKSVKLAAWNAAGGHCQNCTAKLFAGNIEYHHDRECTFAGSAELGNCVVLCRACHSIITRSRAPVIAKSNRVRNRHLGIKRAKRTIPGRRFNGEPIPARWRSATVD